MGPRSAILSILKKSESSQRVLEEATESFQMQLLKEDETGEDNLTVERLTSDISPVIRLIDSTIYTAIQRRASDIHIETQDDAVYVKYRVDGVLQLAMRPIGRQHASAIVGEHDVLRLDVAMQHAGCVHRRNRLTEVDANLNGFRPSEHLAAVDEVFERAAADELHPESDSIANLFRAVDRHDVGMADPCEHPPFLNE